MFRLRRARQLDRRFAYRRAIGRSGAIVTNEGEFECKIIDFSDGGAKIELAANMIVPPSFYLRVPSEERVGRVCLVWRTGQTLGLKVHCSWSHMAAGPQRNS